MDKSSLTAFQLRLLQVVKSLGKEAWGHRIGLRAFKTRPKEDRYFSYLQGLGMNANRKCNQLVDSGHLHLRFADIDKDRRAYYVLSARGEAALRAEAQAESSS